MWSFEQNQKVVEIGVNKFQFIFNNNDDMERVLNRSPWIYDNQPLVVLPWKEGIQQDDEAFPRTWIWVQLWNLPIHWVTKGIGRKIGRVFDSVKL